MSPPDESVTAVVPTPYLYTDASGIEFHLHRANPVWEAVARNPRAVFAVLDAHAYIPTYWNAKPGTDPTWSAPTSNYAAVQAVGRITVIDDELATADLLTRQLERAQPKGGHGPVEPGSTPFGQMLTGVRGARFDIADVRARFTFGGNMSIAHRHAIAERLERRDGHMDRRAREHLIQRCGWREESLHVFTQPPFSC